MVSLWHSLQGSVGDWGGGGGGFLPENFNLADSNE